MTEVVKVDYVDDVGAILRILKLSGPDVPASLKDGRPLFEVYGFDEIVSESVLESTVMSFVKSRGTLELKDGKVLNCIAVNQVYTVDQGRLDVLIFDKLTRLNQDNPDRTFLLLAQSIFSHFSQSDRKTYNRPRI